ncbi:MAG TPA: alpha/beta hydrolase [Anaerolineae bacterium]|nr:alpha/beta hydrolase [Anaerolineae bacterium]
MITRLFINHKTATQPSPPGTIITVNNIDMHIHCRQPDNYEGGTVILDAGLGGWSSLWGTVFTQTAQFTRVCAYDRAGYGWSESSPIARTPTNIAQELSSLLDTADIPPPYTIVGFSYTGLSSRILAQIDDDVTQLILVDPATEIDNDILPPEIQSQQASLIHIYNFFGFLSRLGIIRALDPKEMAPSAVFISEGEPDIYYEMLTYENWWRTSAQEMQAIVSNAAADDVKNNGAVIPDMPLTVLGIENNYPPDSPFYIIHQRRNQQLEKLAEQSTQGQFQLVINSTHQMNKDRPDVIIETIKAYTTE